MKKLIFTFCCTIVCITVSLSVFADSGLSRKVRKYSGKFDDVTSGSWYFNDVIEVYELGLMDGVSEREFNTDGTLNVAQGITIAARLSSLYNAKPIPEIHGAYHWYDKYIAYAIDNGIITGKEYESYNRTIMSYEMVQLFAKALPKDYFPAINTVTEIPDVTESLAYYPDVLMFYNAGILNGNDEFGWFFPASSITRARAAAIINRVALPANRLKFTLKKCTATYGFSDFHQLVGKICQPSDFDDAMAMQIGKKPVSFCEFKYVYGMLKGQYSGDELKSQIVAHLATSAAVVEISELKKIYLTYDDMRKLLEKYYQTMYSYGENFRIILSGNNLSDHYFCENEMLNVLYEKEVQELFSQGNSDFWTKDDVIKYAHDNYCIRVKSIFIPFDQYDSERQAQAALESALSGSDFDELVKVYGTNPNTSWLSDGFFFCKGTMDEEFESAAYALNDGEISNVVKTHDGFYIIKRFGYTDKELENSEYFKTLETSLAKHAVDLRFSQIIDSLQVEYLYPYEKLIELYS